MADFELGFGQARKAAAIEQFGFEAGSPVLAVLVGVNDEPGQWPAHHEGAAQGLAHAVFGHGVAHVPACNFVRATVQPRGQAQPAAALAG